MNTDKQLEQKCVSGCKSFTGGEKLHHKDCMFYPGSISEKYNQFINTDKPKEDKIINLKPVIYAAMYPTLRDIAKEYGYSLSIHGSMARDFDLVAVPWIDDVKPAEQLIEAYLKYTGGYLTEHEEWPRLKPHGRRCWSIFVSGDKYLDISVMPCLLPLKETDAVEFAEWVSDNQWHYSKDFNHWVKMEQFRPAIKSSTELYNLFLNKK